MKILFIIRDMFMGGAGKQLALTAKGMVDKGHSVAIFTYIGMSLEHTLDSRLKYIPGKEIGRNKISEYTKAPKHVRQVVKEVKPDVVISWRANAGCMAVLGCIGLPVKIVFSERSDPYMETNWMLKIATKICDLSTGGVFQTEKAKEFYKKLNKKSIVCPNLINMNNNQVSIVSVEKRRKEIAWVGRFSNTQKRIDIAIKAFKIIHEEMPDYHLSFYGDGIDMNFAKNMVNEEKLQDFVHFHGTIKNVIDVLSTARMLMLSSDYEGIPNVVIESFVAGTPVVATDCSPGGVRVLIDDGNNGFVVPVRDIRSLARKSIEVLKDNALSEKFIINGRKQLQLLKPDKIIDRWNKYLYKIVQE